jgi:hypothetical protein
LLSLILSATSGCVTDLTEHAPVNGYCRITKPISYDSKVDTPETVRQIEEHNSRYVCVCEGDCPSKME